MLHYLRLMRLPNVFTAIADILMGFAFVRGGFQPLGWLLALCGASAALYTAGMVLNDYFDLDIDLRERPQRPLPSGQISLSTARTLGFGLLGAGMLLAGLASGIAQAPGVVVARTLDVAGTLAAVIVAYDVTLKHTPLGPWAMGACRLLNVWLGMTAASQAQSWPAWQPAGLCVSAGIGVYIVGVTWFARREAETSARGGLVLGMVLMLAGWCLLGALPYVTDRKLTLDPLLWVLLLVMLALPILRRTFTALTDPSPRNVQVAVKQCIMTLIFMDAAVVLQVASPLHSLVVIALLAPMLLLGRWVYST